MRLTVLLTEQEFRALQRRSLQERRDPREQAAVLIAQALREQNPNSERTEDGNHEHRTT